MTVTYINCGITIQNCLNKGWSIFTNDSWTPLSSFSIKDLNKLELIFNQSLFPQGIKDSIRYHLSNKRNENDQTLDLININ